ncbi:MAG: ATP-binding protein [Deltaproteobacteria bacterium]|nr:ATP-binding protein [Deltaproteobacteria bacterium]
MLFFEEDLLYLYPNIIYLTIYRNGFDGEVLFRQKDGKKIFVHLCTTSFKEEGEVFLTFAFQEIQRLKNLEQERQEVEHWASLGRMIEEIAHQFRNPIASVGGYAHRMLKGDTLASKDKKYLRRIVQETNRLEALLQRVEEYIKIPPPIFHGENLPKVVQEAITRFSQSVPKGVEIRLDTKGLSGDGQFYIDRELIIRVLLHILDNSLEAIQQKPRKKAKEVIDLQLLDDGEVMEIAITDRGLGIPKKNLNLVFDPFFTNHPHRVGLGLTFVRKVMHEHGARVSLGSRLQRGTTVHLFFSKDRRRKLRRESILPDSLKQED